MTYFFQLVVSGVVVGCIYTLVALGFVLIYKSSRVVSLAQGQILAIGCFTIFALSVWVGLPIYLAFGLGLAASFLLGLVIERLFLRRLIGEPIISVIMVTIGLASVLDGLIYLTPFGSVNFSFPVFLPETPIELAGVTISWIQLTSVLLTVVLIGGFGWFFKYSTLGIAMRAVSDDQLAALSIGVSVERVFGLAWAISGLSTAAAGFVVGNVTGLNFDTIHGIGIVVLPAVILGGLDSIAGAVIGSITIGLLQQFAEGYLDGNFGLAGTSEVLPYVVLVIILLIKPHGLFGTHEIERV